MINFSKPAYSQLFDNNTFDRAFMKDVHECQDSLIIESPFIRLNRVANLIPELRKLRSKGVTIIVNTRPPEEHDDEYALQALEAVALLQDAGITVLFTIKHHRKLAVIDQETFWEGSLIAINLVWEKNVWHRLILDDEST